MDGLTVWVNHPTISNPDLETIFDAVFEAVQARHEGAALQTNHLPNAGPKATIIWCATEAIRRLFTDYHIGANVTIEGTTHHLQIMGYRGGGNKVFILANCKIFAESLNVVARAVQAAYETEHFTMFQCTSRKQTLKPDHFFIDFATPPIRALWQLGLVCKT